MILLIECDTKCNDGMCMVTKWCDTEKDCPDGEDEEECCTSKSPFAFKIQIR